MIQKLDDLLVELKLELKKVDRGNQSAAIRARKILQEIRLESKNIRIQIQELKNRERI